MEEEDLSVSVTRRLALGRYPQSSSAGRDLCSESCMLLAELSAEDDLVCARRTKPRLF